MENEGILYLSFSEYNDTKKTVIRRVLKSRKAAFRRIGYAEHARSREIFYPISIRVFMCDMQKGIITEVFDTEKENGNGK